MEFRLQARIGWPTPYAVNKTFDSEACSKPLILLCHFFDIETKVLWTLCLFSP
jgi:hypothetical protein